MREKNNTDLVVIHCMKHKLELAVLDTVKTKKTQTSKSLPDVHRLVVCILPNTWELEAVATEPGIQAKGVGNIFGIC